MAYYLLQVTYTTEAWTALIRSPQNRVEVVRPVAERLGGTLENAWFSLGEYDVVALLKMPDNVNAAAFAMAASASGGMTAIKTTPLLTMEEGMEAMKLAGGAGYRPPLG